jgi:hypothetical protein
MLEGQGEETEYLWGACLSQAFIQVDIYAQCPLG